ncbi:MAG TPA: Asp-tRNA(Asn)/Glu-tRNA(Gln) amidotransferase subunit GatC [Gemmatimonadales bacterium]|nr:Asp-tRNA(Asn)/Glu-tRNA(Gln) amidotransferase subunit GatC [Gemmatimonadales bacterium]
MSIGKEQVLHVARLAELAVADGDVPKLVEQLNRIVDFVAQLEEVPAGESAPPFVAGPAQVALREDVPGAVPLARPPAQMAPEFRDGLYLVPRLGAMEEA